MTRAKLAEVSFAIRHSSKRTWRSPRRGTDTLILSLCLGTHDDDDDDDDDGCLLNDDIDDIDDSDEMNGIIPNDDGNLNDGDGYGDGYGDGDNDG